MNKNYYLTNEEDSDCLKASLESVKEGRVMLVNSFAVVTTAVMIAAYITRELK